MFRYIVVHAESPEELSKKVQEKAQIEEFKLAGGVQIVNQAGARYLTFFQAMYKND